MVSRGNVLCSLLPVYSSLSLLLSRFDYSNENPLRNSKQSPSIISKLMIYYWADGPSRNRYLSNKYNTLGHKLF